MKNISVTTLAVAIALSGGLTVLPASPAFAQKGSKLCGYTAITPTGAVGLLYEARQEDNSYTNQCDNAIKKIWTDIQNDPQLRQLTWTKQYKQVCEKASENFATVKSGGDLCDPMVAKIFYQITNTKSSDTTTFVQL